MNGTKTRITIIYMPICSPGSVCGRARFAPASARSREVQQI